MGGFRCAGRCNSSTHATARRSAERTIRGRGGVLAEKNGLASFTRVRPTWQRWPWRYAPSYWSEQAPWSLPRSTCWLGCEPACVGDPSSRIGLPPWRIRHRESNRDEALTPRRQQRLTVRKKEQYTAIAHSYNNWRRRHINRRSPQPQASSATRWRLAYIRCGSR